MEPYKNSKESYNDIDLGSLEYHVAGFHESFSMVCEKICDNLGESISYLKKLSDNQKDLRKLLELISLQMWYPDGIDLLNSENLKRNRLNLNEHLFYNTRPITVTVTHEKPSVEYILTRICWCGHEKASMDPNFMMKQNVQLCHVLVKSLNFNG